MYSSLQEIGLKTQTLTKVLKVDERDDVKIGKLSF